MLLLPPLQSLWFVAACMLGVRLGAALWERAVAAVRMCMAGLTLPTFVSCCLGVDVGTSGIAFVARHEIEPWTTPTHVGS